MPAFRLVIAALALSGTTLPAAAAFELSENYVPSAELRSGYYICRTVYDLYSATNSFFANDEISAYTAMNTTRVGDGNTVIILRSDLGDGMIVDEYCPWIE